MKRPLFCLVFCLWISALVCGQNAPGSGMTSIHGRVRDAVTNKGIEHVIVLLEDQDSGYNNQSETDGLGRFGFQGVRASVYEVKVRFPGYESASQRVDLTVTSSNNLDFQLKPRPDKGIRPAESPGSALSPTAAGAPEKASKEFTAGSKLLAEGKDIPGAIEHLEKAVKAYPLYADAYVQLGMAYMQIGKPENAKSDLQKAIDADPKLVPAYVTFGMVFNYLKDYPSAEKNLARALDLNPESPQAHYELAKTYWAMGRWQDAEPHALKCAALQPQMAAVHVVLGNISLKKNDQAGALKEFQEYLRLDPKGPMAGGVQSMVQKLQSSTGAAKASP